MPDEAACCGGNLFGRGWGLGLIGITGGLYGVLPGCRGGLWYTGEGRFPGNIIRKL